MIVVPFIPSHIKDFVIQKEQNDISDKILNDEYIEIISSNETYTGIIDGKPVIISGVLPINGNLIGWAILSDDAKYHLISITRAIKSFIKHNNIDNIQMFVRDGFSEGCKWGNILGFKHNNVVVNNINDGKFYKLFVR